MQVAGVHLTGSGCPRCRVSSGEKTISLCLLNFGFDEVHQWKDHDLKVTRQLPFDHYVPQLNLVIEYDGEQHYEPIVFGGRDKSKVEKLFQGIQYRDCLKRDWALKHKIHFMRVPYWIEEIEEYLAPRLSLVLSSTETIIDPPLGEGWNRPS